MSVRIPPLRERREEIAPLAERFVLEAARRIGRVPPMLTPAAVERLRPRLAPHGYTPFLREDDGLAWVHAIAQTDVVEPSRPLLHLGLFVATVITTLLAGAVEQGVGLWEMWAQPSRILAGLPFSATLIAILGVHEFGHYGVGRHHGMPVSLPFFIPVPPVQPFILGTMGAVIRLRGAIRDRRALFDMAVAGPLAGLLIAVPAYVIGIKWSRVISIAEITSRAGDEPFLGPSILSVLVHHLVLGPLPPGAGGIELHPIATAAWFGFFVTALNLIPAGQLDGGHIVYAMFGSRHTLISKLAVAGLVAIGLLFGSLNWLVWAILIVGLMGFRHAPTMDDITPLDGRRRAVGIFALVLLALLLPPVPLSVG